jgi:AraC-like DNA-binding protein
MNPVAKALWFIESHLTQELMLDEVANAGGVSRYHMSRVFGIATGYSITRYVRGRRLTEAARTLARGAPDILAVALDAGYGSHEAFTRAFRDQFGLTPEGLRASGNLKGIELMEPIKMDETLLANLEPPRFEKLKTLQRSGGPGSRFGTSGCRNPDIRRRKLLNSSVTAKNSTPGREPAASRYGFRSRHPDRATALGHRLTWTRVGDPMIALRAD